jgi:hypothetical protein
MDLITFAGSGHSHVTTLRSIDWEKLFNSVCANSSGAIAWRPDGKELAVGTNSGRITLLKTETGLEREVDGEFQAVPEAESEARIHCLHWTADRINVRRSSRKMDVEMDDEEFDEGSNFDDSDDDMAFASHSFLSGPKKLPQLTAAGKLKTDDDDNGTVTVEGITAEGREDARESAVAGSRCDRSLLKGSSLDVLVAGNDQGTVSLHVFGHFTIGTVDLRSLSPGDKDLATKITHVFLAENLEMLVAVAQKSREMEGLNEFYLCTISTRLLSTSRRQIAAVASEFTFIRGELGRFQVALDQAARFWEEGILGSLRKLFAPLVDEEELIREAKGDTTSRRQMLNQVLFELLTKGVYGTSLVRFFTKQNEVNISRICRVWDAACEALTKLLELTCTPSAEGLIFRLGDLMGKSQADEGFRSIGVEPTLLEPFLKESEKLLLAIQRCCVMVRDAKQNLNSLEKWLLGCRRRWPGGAVQQQQPQHPVPFPHEDAKRVERMLFDGDIEHRELSAQLGLKERASKIVTGKKSIPSWDREYVEQDEDDDELSGTSRKENNALRVASLVANLSAKWADVMPSVRKAMNKSFSVVGAKLLFSIATDERIGDVSGKIALGCTQRDLMDVAFVSNEDRNQVTLLSCDTRAVNPTWKPRFSVYHEDTGQVTHVAFFGGSPGRSPTLEGSLLVLATDDHDLKILGDKETGQLTTLRHCRMGFNSTDVIANIACSGPRGVACVFSTRRNFELYDMVHSEDGEDDIY